MRNKSLGKGLVILLVVTMLFSLGAVNLSTAQALPGPDDTVFSSTNEKVDVLIGFYQTPGPSERTLVRAHGGEIYRQFTIVDTIAATMTLQAADALTQNSSVRYVEPDGPVHALDQTVPWGIDRVFGDEEYKFATWDDSTGVGMAVAIIDTGIDEVHEDLPELLGGVNTIDDTHWGDDGSGHGTHVAGTVAALDNDMGVVGVAPKADLYAVKVLDDGGSGTISSVVKGIEWANEQEIPVMNMSLGTADHYQTLQDACDSAYSTGHLLVAAAGNSGNPPGRGESVGYPAAYNSVIAVAASTNNDNRASFSSTGPEVEIIAPGSSILSTTPGNSYETNSGTSMASPHVAGAAALAWAGNSDLTNAEIREILQDTAEDLGLSSNHQGYGMVRADWAVSAVLDVEKPEYEVVVVAPEDAEETETGMHTYNFEIKNTGPEEDTYDLTAGSSDGNFITNVQEEVTVAAGAVAEIDVDVEITEDAEAGDSAKITLTAESDDASDSDSMVVTLIGEPEVETIGSSNVTSTSAILEGKLTDLGGADSVKAWFEWADNFDLGNSEITDKMTFGAPGFFENTVDGLDPNTTYYFRALAENDAGIYKGAVKEFTTKEEEELAEPEIRTFEVDTRTAGPWNRADVEWKVFHEDGELSEVKSELFDGEGKLLDSETTSVSGKEASGEHNLRTRDDANKVHLTVTDTKGQEASQTKKLDW